jgi:chemotaxis protein methyltransferase CheR
VAGGSNQPPWHPEVAELLVAERWSEVVEMVDASIKQEGEDLRLLQYKARAMANLGQLARAEQLFECILAQDPTDKHTYLIQSCVLTELNKLPEAEEALRKVIYLDPELAEAHYQVGLLRLRDGRLEAGLKSLQNALQLAEKSDPHGIVHGTQDVTYHRLTQILRNEIAMYSRMCDPSGNPRMDTVL